MIDPAALLEICQYLREDPELAMDCLSNETGVDYKDHVEVVYHLFSYSHRHGAVLKIKLPREEPRVADPRENLEVGQLDGARNFRPRWASTSRAIAICAAS